MARAGTYYDRDGVPLDSAGWARLLNDAVYRRVARTKVVDGAAPDKAFDVSTVWHGFDHNFYGVGAPVIFETMVFAEGSMLDLGCRRYCTEAEARAGHTQMVVETTQGLTDPLVIDVES